MLPEGHQIDDVVIVAFFRRELNVELAEYFPFFTYTHTHHHNIPYELWMNYGHIKNERK